MFCNRKKMHRSLIMIMETALACQAHVYPKPVHWALPRQLLSTCKTKKKRRKKRVAKFIFISYYTPLHLWQALLCITVKLPSQFDSSYYDGHKKELYSYEKIYIRKPYKGMLGLPVPYFYTWYHNFIKWNYKMNY